MILVEWTCCKPLSEIDLKHFCLIPIRNNTFAANENFDAGVVVSSYLLLFIILLSFIISISN